jgi:putative heme transporter
LYGGHGGAADRLGPIMDGTAASEAADVEVAMAADDLPQPANVTDPTVAAVPLGVVPGWLDRLSAIGWRILVTIALAIVFANLAIYLGTVTGAILVGLTVAAMVYPIVVRLQVRRGWPRARAAAAASFLAVIIVVIVLFVIILAFIPSIVAIIQANRAGVAALTSFLTERGAPQPVLDIVDRAVTEVQAWLATGLAQLVGPIANFTTIMILGGFLTFYLLEDGDRAWDQATSRLGDEHAEVMTQRGTLALEQVSGYLRGTSVMAITDGLFATAILFILGVPFAGPLGVFVFIGGFVPYLGSLATTTVLLLVTFATQGVGGVALLLVLLGLSNVAQQRWLVPRVFGAGPRVNPGVALISVAIGGALFGPLGLFAAVPVLASVQAFAPAVLDALETGGPHESTRRGLVPVWLDRVAQISWRTLVVLALLAIVVRVILLPILSLPVILAAILACVLRPVARLARERGANPTGAAAFATAASVGAVLLIVGITIWGLLGSLDEVVDTTTLGAGSLNGAATPADLVRWIGEGLLGTAAAVVADAAGIAIGIAISLVLTFYLLRDGAGWWSAILGRIPADRRPGVDFAGTQSVDILYKSMVGTAIVSFAGAVMQWITMTLLGLPLAIPISILMFFGGFIPYIGSLIVTLLGFLVALAVGSTADIILMGIFTIVFNIVQGNIVAPLVYGKTVSIHPAVVLLGAPAGAAIAGIVGMVLIIPVLAIISRTWRTVVHLFDVDPNAPPGAVTATATTEATRRAPPGIETPAPAPATGG